MIHIKRFKILEMLLSTKFCSCRFEHARIFCACCL